MTAPESGPGPTPGPVSGEASGEASEHASAPAPPSSAPDNLGHRTSRGIAVTVGGLWSRTLIQTASTVVLARLLAPEDFGLVAMVTAIVGIADLVRDFGMTGAIIQARRLSDEMWRGVLWFSIAVGTVLMLAIGASAPLIASLYNEPRLVPIVLLIAPGLLLNGIAMPMQARITRDLRFGSLANIDVVPMAVGVGLSIATAALGWGVWSLVVLSGAAQICRLTMLWVITKPKFGRPRIPREVWPLVATGGSIFGAEALNYAERNLDNVIIGQQLGPAVLGQYTRAYALFLLPMQQMNGPLARVALPVLSRLHDDPERYRRYIRASVLVTGYLTIPTYAVAAAVAPALIAVLLGNGWSQAADIFSLLAIAGVAQAVGKVRSWLYITLGRSHRQFAYDLVARPIVIAGYFVGIMWGGVYGLAIVYGVLSAVLLVPGFWFAIMGTFVKAGDIVLPLLRPAALAVVAFAAAYAVEQAIHLPAFAELVIGTAAGLVPFAAALAIPAYRHDLGGILDFAKRLRKPKPRAETAATEHAPDGTAPDRTAPDRTTPDRTAPDRPPAPEPESE